MITLNAGELTRLDATLTPVAEANIIVENLSILPAKVVAGVDEVRITVDIVNIGASVGTKTITCLVNGLPFSSYTAQLNPGAYTRHTFRHEGQLYVPPTAGFYSVEVDGLTGTFEALFTPPMPPPPDPEAGVAKWYGIVIDYLTGAPIEGVQIIYGPDSYWYTDANGWFYGTCYNPGGGCAWNFRKEGYYIAQCSGTYYPGDVVLYVISMLPIPTNRITVTGRVMWRERGEETYQPGAGFLVTLRRWLEDPVYETYADSDGYFTLADVAVPSGEGLADIYFRIEGMGKGWLILEGQYSISPYDWVSQDVGTLYCIPRIGFP